MPYIREPGSRVERTVPREDGLPPEERAIFVFKVLTHGQWLRFEALARSLKSKDIAGALEVSRSLLAMALVEVRNIKTIQESGAVKTFKLQSKGGKLTERSVSVLHQYLDELINMIAENHTFKDTDAKNSPSPSAISSADGVAIPA